MTYASLVVLSFNRKTYLERSLESLFETTSYPYQLVVMDDASDAETQEYVFSLVKAGKVSSALFNTGHNMGLGTAIRRGFMISRGEYLAKLDSDLLYSAGWLDRAVRLLEDYPKIGCLGLFKYWHKPCHFDDMLVADCDDYYEVQDFVGSAILLRRQVYWECGPWPDTSVSFSEDIEFKKHVQQAGYVLALPKKDLAENFGFGEQHSSLIKVIDWERGQHQYYTPDPDPVIFGR